MNTAMRRIPPLAPTTPPTRAAFLLSARTDVLRLVAVIILTLALLLVALARCDMDSPDDYGQPNSPGYSVPVSDQVQFRT